MSKNAAGAAQLSTNGQQGDDGQDYPFPNQGMPQGSIQMLLPPSMRRKSYNSYVIDAVRADPLQNPLFTKSSLRNNDRVRDAVRAVLQTGSEREKAILIYLHHKLLSVAAGRLMDQLTTAVRITANGFARPLIPGLLPAPAAAAYGADPANAPAEQDAEPAATATPRTSTSPKVPVWRKVLAVLTTPKYFITAAGLTLAVTTGLWQLQVRNLNNTIHSYEGAVKATEVIEGRMKAQVESAEKDLRSSADSRRQLVLDLATANVDLLQTSIKLGAKDGELTALKTQLKVAQEAAAKQGSTASEKETTLQASLMQAEARASAAEAELKVLREQKAGLATTVETQQKSLTDSQTNVNALRADNAKLLTSTSALTTDSIKLTFAQSFVESVRQHVAWNSNVKTDKIKSWIEQYDQAMETVTRKP